MQMIESDSREVKLGESLALFQAGSISLWKAARLADVSLLEMVSFAVAQGGQPSVDEDSSQEE